MEITEDQYKEYEQLLVWKKKEDIRLSLRETKKLEDDIDEPIKSCVMMFALLGAVPIYSCCGFDYEGQPYHKSHQYGQPYILFAEKPKFEINLPPMWEFKQRAEFEKYWMVVLRDGVSPNPHWTDPSCIHFSESFVIAIGYLEICLWNKLEDRDKSIVGVTLLDTNSFAVKENPYWQYIPKEPWRFTFDDVVKRVKSIWGATQ